MNGSISLERIVSLLQKEYGNPDLGNLSDPTDEIVFIILSEKTDEAKYLSAFCKLKTHFSRWDQLLNARVSAIECLIREAGFGRRRARLIKEAMRAIVDRFGSLDLSMLMEMPLEEAEKELMGLPGVGRKAARCVLLYCFNLAVLPVDVHTYRLAVRLGLLSRNVSYQQSHILLPPLIPKKLRRAFHVNAVAHGRARCFARNPNCRGCPLTRFCSHPTAIKPLPIEVRPRPIAIDLFAGAGGLSLGFKKAGFHIIQAVESDARAAATYQKNHPEVDLLQEDIRRLAPLDCLRRLSLRPGDVRALIAGPPCQGFSESNRRTRTLANPGNHFYREFLRFAKSVRPAWIVIENVAGLRTLSNGLILKRIVSGCQSLGYKVQWAELNSAQYGAPQLRRRLFIVANRAGLPFRFPEAIYGLDGRPFLTVRDAIGDLPPLKSGASIEYLPYRNNAHQLTGYQRLMRQSGNKGLQIQGHLVSRNGPRVMARYKHIRPGQNWEAIPANLLDNYEDTSRCHTGIYHRLQWNRPSKVVGNFRKNMLIHPQQDRGLSVREAARLQSFPDEFIFIGSIGFQQQQVADAVPPLLAEAVARSILASTNLKPLRATPVVGVARGLPHLGRGLE